MLHFAIGLFCLWPLSGDSATTLRRVGDTPRKKVLIDGFRRENAAVNLKNEAVKVTGASPPSEV